MAIFKEQNLPPISVPQEALSGDALMGLIESFILREGTDYGLIEVSHNEKIKSIESLLASGEIKIVFDPNTESVTPMTSREFTRLFADNEKLIPKQHEGV